MSSEVEKMSDKVLEDMLERTKTGYHLTHADILEYYNQKKNPTKNKYTISKGVLIRVAPERKT